MSEEIFENNQPKLSPKGWRTCAICGDQFKRKRDKHKEQGIELIIPATWCSDCYLLPF